MELKQLRSFVAAAEMLHFGEAARRLGILPAVLGRQIQALESALRVRLFRRSTRQVALTDAGRTLVPIARRLLADVDALPALLRGSTPRASTILRVGAIDSAAAGLMPRLIADLRPVHPELEIALVEDKTVRLLPKLLAGQIDLAFVRPPDRYDRRLACLPLFDEHAIVALPADHPLSQRHRITIGDLHDTPMILPSRRSRPHSHDLTVKLFESASIPLTVAQEAEEKHTILGLVGAGIGAAIVPRWSALAGIGGIVFLPIDGEQPAYRLPLAAMWIEDAVDPARDVVIAAVQQQLDRYAQAA